MSKLKKPAGNAAGRKLAESTANLHAELTRYLRRRVSISEDAHDIAQEAYVRLTQVPNAELIENPVGYLYKIATNLANDHYRKTKQSPDMLDLDSLSKSGGDGDGDAFDRRIEARSELSKLDNALQAMPKLYRDVLVLRKRDQYSHAEIAEILNISMHTVHKYLTRALAHVREHAEKSK